MKEIDLLRKIVTDKGNVRVSEQYSLPSPNGRTYIITLDELLKGIQKKRAAGNVLSIYYLARRKGMTDELIPSFIRGIAHCIILKCIFGDPDYISFYDVKVV